MYLDTFSSETDVADLSFPTTTTIRLSYRWECPADWSATDPQENQFF